MKAKINDKILCIPPYLSTSWDQVLFLHTEENPENKKFSLIVHLTDGKIISITDLEPSLIDIAFSGHMQYLERGGKVIKGNGSIQNFLNDQLTTVFPIKLGISPGQNFEGIEMAFQHNPQQSHASALPEDVLEKIVEIAKAITNGNLASFPKAEPHCNCMHCQVARAIHNPASPEKGEATEEPVTEEDLHFRSWEILQTGEKLYIVTNPIDPKEKYNVYLGTPVGCTCGTPHCEHIKAVLFS